MQDLRVGMDKQFSYANSHTIIFQLQTFVENLMSHMCDYVHVIACACEGVVTV